MRVICLIALTLLMGCDDKFRYCKPPVCVATGTCPEQLVKPEAEKK